MKGIDVSSYQGTINWPIVKQAGVGFAILKVIRKDGNPDKQFEANWAGCEAADMPVYGVYNYSYATTVHKAVEDAKKVVSILNGRKTTVWLDIEDSCLRGLGHTLADIIIEYRSVIESSGIYCTI